MTGRRKPQVENMEIAGGKNEEIPFREIRKEEYRKMLDKKLYIREMNEEGCMKMLDEKLYIREMNEEEYMKMENEKLYIREIPEQEYRMENKKNNLEKKIMTYIWKMIFLKLINIYF